VAELYASEPTRKWRAVLTLGLAVGELTREKAERQMRHFLWAMNDESGAVPYGIPEALGEMLAVRPELKPGVLPILVSFLVSEDLYQTGKILAGAIWALGRVGLEDPEEKTRALPGLRSALDSDEPQVRGAAVWAATRLDLAADLADNIGSLVEDNAIIILLVNGKIEEIEIGDLARRALGL
jgi:hypothetical protein